MEKAFEIKVSGRSYLLKLGNCAVCLFRQNPEASYLAVDLNQQEPEETGTMRIFNNIDLCEWMAGLAIRESGGNYFYDCVVKDDKTFNEEYGWLPATVIKQAPNLREQEWYLDVAIDGLDKEWQDFDS